MHEQKEFPSHETSEIIITGADLCGPPGDLTENLDACLVAEVVVDLLESVDVKAEEDDLAIVYQASLLEDLVSLRTKSSRFAAPEL